MNRIENYNNGDHSAEMLAERVETSRQQMDESYERLTQHSASDYLEGAVGWAKEKVGSIDTERLSQAPSRAWDSISETAKEHPLPFILGGLAIASAFLPKRSERGSDDEYSYEPPEIEPNSLVTPEPLTSATIETDRVVVRNNSDSSEYLEGEPIVETSSTGKRIRAAAADKLADAKEKTSSAWKSVKGKTQDAYSETKDAVSETGHSAKVKAWSASETVREKSQQLAVASKKAASKTGERLREEKETHPLAMCAGALATGLLAALIVPTTRKEGELCGEDAEEFRQSMKDKAEQSVEGLHEKAEDKIEESADQLEEQLTS